MATFRKSQITYEFHIEQMEKVKQSSPSMVTDFRCPVCGKKLYSMKPTKIDEKYDSTMIAPCCDSVLFKIAYGSGNVTATKI